MSALFLPLLLSAQAVPPEPLRLQCSVALMMPNRQMTAPTPVSISFVTEGTSIRDIHVVDAGGILYPGGNMQLTQKAGSVSLDAVPIPAERPGEWRGVVEKDMYRLTLTSGALAKAVEIGLARKPDKRTQRFGLVWNATNQPPGLPQPISGSGGGNCTASMKDSQ